MKIGIIICDRYKSCAGGNVSGHSKIVKVPLIGMVRMKRWKSLATPAVVVAPAETLNTHLRR